MGKSGVPIKSWTALYFSGAVSLLILLALRPQVSEFSSAGLLPGALSIILSGLLVMLVSVTLFFFTGGEEVRGTLKRVIRRGR